MPGGAWVANYGLQQDIRPSAACRGAALVFINGSILGVHRRPAHFAATLRKLRRRGCVGPYVSVFAQQDCVYLACDGGRVCRPLIVCDAGRPRVTSEHMQVCASATCWAASSVMSNCDDGEAAFGGGHSVDADSLAVQIAASACGRLPASERIGV